MPITLQVPSEAVEWDIPFVAADLLSPGSLGAVAEGIDENAGGVEGPVAALATIVVEKTE